MPYYIYQITEQPIKLLKNIEQHETYRDASARVKQLRAELPDNSAAIIKMIHADNELQAEDLLNEVRVAAPGPDDE